MSNKDLIDSIINNRHFCFVGPVDKFIMNLWLHWAARNTPRPALTKR
jgi:hypothetical protein